MINKNDLILSIVKLIKNISVVPDICDEILGNDDNDMNGNRLIECLGEISSSYELFQRNLVDLFKNASIEKELSNDAECIKAQITKNGFIIKESKDE